MSENLSLDDEPSEETLAAWPNCATPDCENKACLWAGTGLCYPCSRSFGGVSEAEMQQRYALTRTSDGHSWNGETCAQ